MCVCSRADTGAFLRQAVELATAEAMAAHAIASAPAVFASPIPGKLWPFARPTPQYKPVGRAAGDGRDGSKRSGARSGGDSTGPKSKRHKRVCRPGELSKAARDRAAAAAAAPAEVAAAFTAAATAAAAVGPEVRSNGKDTGAGDGAAPMAAPVPSGLQHSAAGMVDPSGPLLASLFRGRTDTSNNGGGSSGEFQFRRAVLEAGEEKEKGDEEEHKQMEQEGVRAEASSGGDGSRSGEGSDSFGDGGSGGSDDGGIAAALGQGAELNAQQEDGGVDGLFGDGGSSGGDDSGGHSSADDGPGAAVEGDCVDEALVGQEEIEGAGATPLPTLSFEDTNAASGGGGVGGGGHFLCYLLEGVATRRRVIGHTSGVMGVEAGRGFAGLTAGFVRDEDQVLKSAGTLERARVSAATPFRLYLVFDVSLFTLCEFRFAANRL